MISHSSLCYQHYIMQEVGFGRQEKIAVYKSNPS